MHIYSHKVYEYIFVNGQLHGLFSAVYLCRMKILTVITHILIFITCVYYSAAWDHIYGVLVPLWYGALKSIISILLLLFLFCVHVYIYSQYINMYLS